MEQINNIEAVPQNRVSEVVDKAELKKWKQQFSLYGAKARCEALTKVHVNTIRRVLSEGRGEKETIEKIRGYVNELA